MAILTQCSSLPPFHPFASTMHQVRRRLNRGLGLSNMNVAVSYIEGFVPDLFHDLEEPLQE